MSLHRFLGTSARLSEALRSLLETTSSGFGPEVISARFECDPPEGIAAKSRTVSDDTQDLVETLLVLPPVNQFG